MEDLETADDVYRLMRNGVDFEDELQLLMDINCLL